LGHDLGDALLFCGSLRRVEDCRDQLGQLAGLGAGLLGQPVVVADES